MVTATDTEYQIKNRKQLKCQRAAESDWYHSFAFAVFFYPRSW